MAKFGNCELDFPSRPPEPRPKPKLGSRIKPQDWDRFSLWGAHDPAIFRDPGSGNYYTYNTRGIARRSQDLLTWETIGKVVAEPPPEAQEWVGSANIWAPDIIKVGPDYRLYCSNSTWGVRQSCIFLAVADSPEGLFTPAGIVLQTDNSSPVNAIDANPVEEQTTGDHYMAYGSFWGGCRLIKLNKDTGLAAEPGLGICIARRPKWAETAIEGPYIKFNSDFGYYYLFVSYGSLNSDYNIRVARSTAITGPYYDPQGRLMTDLEDFTNEVGLMIACGYRFDQGQGYMAPGHNSVLQDVDGRWYLVCHIREHNFKQPQISTMHIYQMFWTDDGWPLLNPQPYAGEKLQAVPREWLSGEYERIKLIPTIPQGVLCSVPMTLKADGSFHSCTARGRWEQINETTISVSYGKTVETFIVTPAWDWQLDKPTIAITGKDRSGIAIWGKKV